MVFLPAELHSLDPDYPADSGSLEFFWFCRRTAPDPEKYRDLDVDGNPTWSEARAQGIPPPSDPQLLNTPNGCFGRGPGPLKKRAGTLSINTASFVTYNQVYEITVVVTKGEG